MEYCNEDMTRFQIAACLASAMVQVNQVGYFETQLSNRHMFFSPNSREEEDVRIALEGLLACFPELVDAQRFLETDEEDREDFVLEQLEMNGVC